jgi:outer membrane protein assembly factor BamD
MRVRWPLSSLLVAILLANCSCLKWNSTESDEILFRRAAIAANQGKYDVARLILQTLVNTYPDSDRVPEARQMIESSYSKENQADPKVSERRASELPNGSMCFFPSPPDQ